MKKLALLFSLLMLSFTSNADSDYLGQAEQQARNWMNNIDAGNASASWETMSELFSQQLTPQDWELSILGMKNYFGEANHRAVQDRTYKQELSGAPEGDYVDVVFKTDYSNAPGRTEIVTMKREQDGQWKVAGFSIE